MGGEPADYAILITGEVKVGPEKTTFRDARFFDAVAPYRLRFRSWKGNLPGVEWQEARFVNEKRGSSWTIRDSQGETKTLVGPETEDSLAPHLAIFAAPEDLRGGATQMFRAYSWSRKRHDDAPLRVRRVERGRIADSTLALVEYEASDGPCAVIGGWRIWRWTLFNQIEFHSDGLSAQPYPDGWRSE